MEVWAGKGDDRAKIYPPRHEDLAPRDWSDSSGFFGAGGGYTLLSKVKPKMRLEIWEKFTSALKSCEATHPVLFDFQ